jgi:hypothetical protein
LTARTPRPPVAGSLTPSVARPLVAGGLAASIPQATRRAISTASGNARALVVPGLLRVGKARELTGPAAGIAGLFGPFVRLTERGWTLTGTAIDEIAGGTPTASGTPTVDGTPTSARFARENVALYIDAVYDGHFDASLIGKGLLAGYLKLGGSEAFGAKLTAAEVDALARAYSPQAERLDPHPGVKLGS